MSRHRAWWCAAALGVSVAVAPARAQTTQYRPELDVYWKSSAHWRTFFQLAGQEENSESPRDPLIGLFEDYLFAPDGYLRAGYRYNLHSYESRPLVELAFRVFKIGPVRLLNRNRVEWRWVDGKYSYRARERVQLQRVPPPKGLGLAPYAMFEAYYDSRYRTIARLAPRVGTTMRLLGPASMDLYYMRQDNLRGKPAYVNIGGLIFEFSY
jgi:Protein of unknown function (DUF2490)